MASWSNLPDEMKGEVLKTSDFLSSQRLRICSKSDLSIVDSLKTDIPFMRIVLSEDNFTIIIIQSLSDILRIDLEKRESDSEVCLFRSQGLEISNEEKVLKNTSFEKEISNILNGVFHRKLEIESLNIENNYQENENPTLQVLKENILRTSPKRLIVSGKSYSETLKLLNPLKKKSDVLIRIWRKDETRSWDNFRDFGLKVYELSRWNSKQGVQEHITAGIAIGLHSYMAHIDSNPLKKTHWIPGFHVENPERALGGYPGFEFERFPNYTLWKARFDKNRKVVAKVAKCGVSIHVGSMGSVDLKERCGLEWICPNCAPKTIENWFFRETVGNLHS